VNIVFYCIDKNKNLCSSGGVGNSGDNVVGSIGGGGAGGGGGGGCNFVGSIGRGGALAAVLVVVEVVVVVGGGIGIVYDGDDISGSDEATVELSRLSFVAFLTSADYVSVSEVISTGSLRSS